MILNQERRPIINYCQGCLTGYEHFYPRDNLHDGRRDRRGNLHRH